MFINLQSSPLVPEYHVSEKWGLFYYFCENILILNSGFLFLFAGYHVSELCNPVFLGEDQHASELCFLQYFLFAEYQSVFFSNFLQNIMYQVSGSSAFSFLCPVEEYHICLPYGILSLFMLYYVSALHTWPFCLAEQVQTSELQCPYS
jgi:hypothetical protein